MNDYIPALGLVGGLVLLFVALFLLAPFAGV